MWDNYTRQYVCVKIAHILYNLKMNENTEIASDKPVNLKVITALQDVLKRLIKLALTQGINYQMLSELLKTAIIFQISNSHAEGVLSFTSGADYSSGKYGQSETTNITYIPFMAKYETDDTTIKLTVPLV